MSPGTSARPTVSVLVTAYRHAAYAERALDSVAAQTFGDYEVVITDDCSGDSTPDVIRRWLDRTRMPATFLANATNMGICAVKNQALRHATGRFVCSLAADDWYEPDRLSRQVEFMRGLPDSVGFVYSDARLVGAQGEPLGGTFLEGFLGQGYVPPEGRITARLLRGNFIPANAVLIRRSALDAVGGYDESLAFEDYYMWLEVAHRYDVRFLPGILTNYRVLETSMSHSPEWRARMRLSTAMILLRWVGVDQAYDSAIAAHVGAARADPKLIRRRFRRTALRHVDTYPDEAARIMAQTTRSPVPTLVQHAYEVLFRLPLGRTVLRYAQLGYKTLARARHRALNRLRGV